MFPQHRRVRRLPSRRRYKPLLPVHHLTTSAPDWPTMLRSRAR